MLKLKFVLSKFDLGLSSPLDQGIVLAPLTPKSSPVDQDSEHATLKPKFEYRLG